MNARTGIAWMTLALVMAPSAATASGRVSAKGIRRAVERGAPGCRLEQVESLKLGRFRLWVVRGLVELSGEEGSAEARELLQALRRVEIVTFEARAGECRLPADLEANLMAPGWSRVVREADSDRGSLVYQHQDRRGELDGLLVVDSDSDELEVVAVEGRVERLLMAAVAGEAVTLSLADR